MKVELTKTKVIKGDINRALKLFKSKTINSGHLEELKERKEYKKPTTVKRKMLKDAIRNQKWADEKQFNELG
jgi:ribosomal protein S21|tara:strand:- start:3708 stop:3923 length:216 start_codon:yes stop_codon:yes gene_type:complete